MDFMFKCLFNLFNFVLSILRTPRYVETLVFVYCFLTLPALTNTTCQNMLNLLSEY